MKTITRIAAIAVVLSVSASALAQPQNRPRGKGRDMERSRGSLKVGDEAPGFKLKSADGKKEVDLASFKGKRPVVLVFGSYT